MQNLRYVGKNLFLERVSIQNFLKKNKTPFYIYSENQIVSNYLNFVKTFKKTNPLICFAAKSNSNTNILRILGKLGAGADVVSGGELLKALKAGIKPKKIVFSGVGKSEEELKLAISKNILLINCESESEAKLVNTLAKSLGKNVKVCVFASDDKQQEAKDAGADIVGSDDLVEKVEGGFIDFDRCISTPDMMSKVGKLGKVLGPRNLMPNPKLGSVTNDLKQAVEDAKSGELEFKNSDTLIQAGIAKSDFEKSDVVSNIKFFYETIAKERPSGIKGDFVKKVSISPTMGPGININLDSFGA